MTLAVEYLHGVDVVHRDLKAENIVFAAKGSPVIKFIDFGGACTWTAEDGLTGLVGTPQYVAPEVVTGYGEDKPTEQPYGKGCDLWSIGVLLYVMLSKTMPFRAKEVDQLLKQVVKGKFAFKPEDRWRNVSPVAKDLIQKLLVVDPTKRLTIAQVREHAWCAEAIKKCAASLPKIQPKAKPGEKEKSGGGGVGSLAASLRRIGSMTGAGSGQGPKPGEKLVKPKPKGQSREQQYWYAMEISPPTNMQQQGGVKLGADGAFQMENVPEEMRAILADIQKKKEDAARNSKPVDDKIAVGGGAAPAAPPPPPPPLPVGVGGSSQPPPPMGPPPDAGAAHTRLVTEGQATLQHRNSEAMDTLLLFGQKEQETRELQEKMEAQVYEIEELKKQVQSLQRGKADSGGPPPIPPAVAAAAAAGNAELAAQLKEAVERADKAESELGAAKAISTKLTAQLNAVSTLYTEAMQREAAMRVMLEQQGKSLPP